MSSTAAELTALGSTTVVDFYRRSFKPDATTRTICSPPSWLHRAVGRRWRSASPRFASLLDNLIQAVNILGSLFYGPILGIFLRRVLLRAACAPRRCSSPRLAAQAARARVFGLSKVGFLWYNVIGCAVVLALAPVLQLASRERRADFSAR